MAAAREVPDVLELLELLDGDVADIARWLLSVVVELWLVDDP